MRNSRAAGHDTSRPSRMAWPVTFCAALALSALITTLGCGKIVSGADADASGDDGGIADSDVSADIYQGQWCDPQSGPSTSLDDAAVFCDIDQFMPDALAYCRFNPISPSWMCCTATDWTCCPGANEANEYGNISPCCASPTDCSTCCSGSSPGAYFDQ